MNTPALVLLLIALCIPSCFLQQNRSEYKPLRGRTKTSSPIINDGLGIQIHPTSHGNSGLFIVTSAPHSVHTRIGTYIPFTAYEITQLTLHLEGKTKSLLSPSQIIHAPATRYPQGLYAANHDFKDAFDWTPSDTNSILLVEMRGFTIQKEKGKRTPFNVTHKFRYVRLKDNSLVTFHDILSL